MSELILAILQIVILIIIIWSVRLILKSIKLKQISGYVFFLPVFIFFFILPGFTDSIFQLGFDPYYRLIKEATSNVKVNIYYNIYIIFLLILFNRHFKKLLKHGIQKVDLNNELIQQKLINIYHKYWWLLWILLTFPIIYIWGIQGGNSYYSTYLFRSEVLRPDYHSFVTKVALGSVISVAYIITVFKLEKKNENKNRDFFLLPVFAILITLFWIHGKRSIVVIYMVVQLIFLVMSGLLSIKKLKIVLPVLIVLFGSFIIFYGKNISGNATKTYQTLRIDFSRDYGVKFVIYNDLIIDRHVLPSYLSTFEFTALFFIPRTMWPTKPQPYAVYFTNSAFGHFGGDHLYGWGLTTSLFAESISNLGFMGLLFAPFLIIFIFNKDSKSKSPFFKLLSMIIGILLIVVQPISFMVLILIYIYLLFKGNKKIVLK